MFASILDVPRRKFGAGALMSVPVQVVFLALAFYFLQDLAGQQVVKPERWACHPSCLTFFPAPEKELKLFTVHRR